ncbi:MAG TPA: DUF4340 domain-containing protein [Blastocatellia bacterium]|nr:DUF4340 domain-containing protein [Blastocatellia bacterium]
MTVKRKQMALLLAGALGAAAFVYFTRCTKDKASEEKPHTGRVAFSFKRQDVASLALRRDGQNVVIENKGGNWAITQPVNAPADQSVVNLLLNGLSEALSAQSLRVLSRKAESYGLNPPSVTLELTLSNGQRHSVGFGDPDSSKQSVYALMDDSPEVVLLPVEIAVSADQPLLNLRDRSLLKVSADEVRLLRLSNGNGEMMLAREDSTWKLKYPVETAADRVAVESLFSEIGSAKVTEFIGESAGVADTLRRDKYKITFIASLLDGSEKALTLGTKEGGSSYAIASDRPQAGKVEGSLYDRLNVKPSDLYDRNIIRFDLDKLKRIVVRNQNQTLAAVNQEGRWVVETPSEYKGKELDLMGPLNSLKAERADDVLHNPSGPVSAKFARPAITAQFVNKNGAAITLLFSAPDGEKVYVRRTNSLFVYKTERHIFNRLNFRVRELVVAN